MPPARAEMPVARASLDDPAVRRSIRMALWRKLLELGKPERVRFVQDPPDSIFADQGLPNDQVAIVRADANVVVR